MMKHTLAIALILKVLILACRAEDMISGESGCQVLIDAHDRASMFSRNYIGGQSNRWPNGVVPYTISSAFTSSQRQVILDSMKQISDQTCVRFVERTDQTNYVDIFTGQRGCYANLGYNQRRARSVVHLQSNGCVYVGIVVHELLHILGFGHEQTRPDRDQYVKINWNNIQSGTYGNFWRALGENEAVTIPYCRNVGIDQYDNCHAGFRASTFGKDYDYGSVMHYGLNYFSNNGQNTISLKQKPTATIPNRSGMSRLDVEKTKAAYQCDSSSTTTEASTTSRETTEASTTSRKTTEASTTPRETTEASTTPRETTQPSTTTTPPSCNDTWKWCHRYTSLCGRHSFINKHCKKTCFSCDCKNKLDDECCSVLRNYCRYSFIKSNCAKECKIC